MLPASVETRIRCWAREAYPAEGCGLLLGDRGEERGRVRVERAMRAVNLAAPVERDRFEVDPGDHLRARLEARSEGLEVVGVWHSHPDRPAHPSQLDARGATRGWSHVIVSVWGGRDVSLASYRFAAEGFVAERSVFPR